jgi:hypothetical protein
MHAACCAQHQACYCQLQYRQVAPDSHLAQGKSAEMFATPHKKGNEYGVRGIDARTAAPAIVKPRPLLQCAQQQAASPIVYNTHAFANVTAGVKFVLILLPSALGLPRAASSELQTVNQQAASLAAPINPDERLQRPLEALKQQQCAHRSVTHYQLPPV